MFRESGWPGVHRRGVSALPVRFPCAGAPSESRNRVGFPLGCVDGKVTDLLVNRCIEINRPAALAQPASRNARDSTLQGAPRRWYPLCLSKSSARPMACVLNLRGHHVRHS